MVKMAKTGPFMFLLDTPTPRRGASPRQRSLSLGEPEPIISTLSSPLRRSIALPWRTCKSCFGSSLLLILTNIHLTNEDSNKKMKGFVQI